MTQGERWATEQLEGLRADGFTASAWTRFLTASFRRAAETRGVRPQLARQAHRWSILGLGAGLAARACARRRGIPAPGFRSFVTWWTAVSAMLDWHLGMVEGPGGERRERLTAADAVTLLRLWLVPLLAAPGTSARASGPVFSVLIAAAAASDAIDGALARHAGTTRLGRDLDKAADVLTVGAAAHAASKAGWLSTRTARLAIVRSALPIAFVAAGYFRTGRRPAIDSIGPGRRLAPALLGGLALAPFSPRAGSALTGAASVGALTLVLVPPTAADEAGALSPESSDGAWRSIGEESASRNREGHSILAVTRSPCLNHQNRPQNRRIREELLPPRN